MSDNTNTLSADSVSEKRVNTTDEDFIASWQGNDSVEAVARALSIKTGSADQRARGMRKHGVPLKHYAIKIRTVKDEAYWARMSAMATAALPESDEDIDA